MSDKQRTVESIDRAIRKALEFGPVYTHDAKALGREGFHNAAFRHSLAVVAARARQRLKTR